MVWTTLISVKLAYRMFAWLSVGLLMAVFTFLATQSTKLRPITDDYCLGASAIDGPFESIAYWLSSWTGAPFSATLLVLLTGWPLASLQFGLSSAIPYVASGLTVGLLVTYLLGSEWKENRFPNGILVALIATGWFVMFRVGQVLELRAGDDPIGNRSWALAEMLTHWQTVNSGYVSASALAMLILAWAFLSPHVNTRRRRMLAIGIASLVVGWTSYAFAVALSASFLLVALGIWFTRKTAFSQQLAFSAVSILTGVATTFLFLGARARTGADVRFTTDVMLEAIRNVPSGIGEWALVIASPPTLFSLVFGIAIASFGLLKTPRLKSSNLVWIVGLLLLASLLIYILNEVTGMLIYGRALWHSIPAQLMIFVAGVTSGFLLVRKIGTIESFGEETKSAISVVYVLATTGVLVLSALGSIVLSGSVSARQEAWENGPSQIRGLDTMVDRATPWVEKCWQDLGGPARLGQ